MTLAVLYRVWPRHGSLTPQSRPNETVEAQDQAHQAQPPRKCLEKEAHRAATLSVMPVLISRPGTTSITHGHCLTGSARMRDPAPGTRVKGRVLYVPQPAPLLPPPLAVHACGTSANHAHGVSVPLPGGGVGGALAIFDKETWKQRSALRRTLGDAHTFADANREWACQMAGGGVPRATTASGGGGGPRSQF